MHIETRPSAQVQPNTSPLMQQQEGYPAEGKQCGSPHPTCARMMRSMLADCPYLPATTTQGVVARRVDTLTLVTWGGVRRGVRGVCVLGWLH